MSRIVHGRLDDATDAARQASTQKLGWSDSKIVREDIKAVSAMLLPDDAHTIVGLGEFHSGISDLGSNKKHRRDFGR